MSNYEVTFIGRYECSDAPCLEQVEQVVDIIIEHLIDEGYNPAAEMNGVKGDVTVSLCVDAETPAEATALSWNLFMGAVTVADAEIIVSNALHSVDWASGSESRKLTHASC